MPQLLLGLKAQTLTQTLRGQIIDRQIQTPLPYASIQVAGTGLGC